MWSCPYHVGALAPLNCDEHQQKETKMVLLLGLLDPAYEGLRSGMKLHRTLSLHSKRSVGGERLSEEIESLLINVLSLRRRDFAYCKNTPGLQENEQHAYAIRSLMQLSNMYHPGRYTYEVFAEYLLDSTPAHQTSFIFVADEQQKQEQQRPRNMGACWRRGSETSVSSESSTLSSTSSTLSSTSSTLSSTSSTLSSTSSSFYTARSAASSTSSIAPPTSYFASERIAIERPRTSAGRLEGNSKGAYVPPARRGSREDISKKTSWR